MISHLPLAGLHILINDLPLLPTICPSCIPVLEIDDRGECVFVDTDSPKMRMHGQICVEWVGATR